MLRQVEFGGNLGLAVRLPTKDQLIPLGRQVKEFLRRLREKGFSARALVPVLIADVFGAPANSDSAIAESVEGRSPKVEVSVTSLTANDKSRGIVAANAVADCVF